MYVQRRRPGQSKSIYWLMEKRKGTWKRKAKTEADDGTVLHDGDWSHETFSSSDTSQLLIFSTMVHFICLVE
jgi:hypothetical protein